MSQTSAVIEVQVRAVLPTKEGCAVFVGNKEKAFVIFVDQNMGAAILAFMRGLPKERPLTHDLMASLLLGLGAKVERVIINDLRDSTYFARLIVSAQHELLTQKKILEIDARPSDAIAMAIQQKATLYVARKVWDEVDDMSEQLRQMEEGGFEIE